MTLDRQASRWRRSRFRHGRLFGAGSLAGDSPRATFRAMHRNVVRFALLMLTTLMVCVTAVAAAQAEVRVGSGTDPRDVPEAVSGGRQPDIEGVRVSYDSAGVLSVTVRLFEPWTQTSKAYPNFDIAIGSSSTSYSYSCSTSGQGDVFMLGYLDPASASKGAVSLMGYDGSIPAERSFSADGRETTFTVQAPQLAGRNYICATSSSVFRSDPYGHCSPSINNCERISYRYTGDTASEFFFAGFAPSRPACDDGIDNEGDGKVDIDDPDCDYDRTRTSEGAPPTACANGRDDDGDGKVDRNDPGCKNSKAGTSETDPAPVRSSFKVISLGVTRKCHLDTQVEVLPDLVPERLFPFNKVSLTVRGISGKARGYRKTRRLPLGYSSGYRFKSLKPGRYRVSGYYPGDRYRLRSRTRSRTVSVCRSKRS